jgi:hypothetical protein
VGQLAAFLAKIFASKKDKKELCCGIELEEIDDVSALPVGAGKDACSCAKPDKVQPRILT